MVNLHDEELLAEGWILGVGGMSMRRRERWMDFWFSQSILPLSLCGSARRLPYRGHLDKAGNGRANRPR